MKRFRKRQSIYLRSETFNTTKKFCESSSVNPPTAQSEMISFSFSGKKYCTERVIGNLGVETGPTFVFIGGMHGNEPTGALAIQQVFEGIQSAKIPLSGRVIGFVGNLEALKQGQRFISDDMNRSWNQALLKSYLKTPDEQPEANGPDLPH